MPDLRLIIATPIDGTPSTGSVSSGYASQLARMYRAGAVDAVPSSLMFSGDVVRARNRAVWHVLSQTDATHVLWWDEDVVPAEAPTLVNALLATGHDIVGAPYPTKGLQPRIARVPLRDPGEPVNECVRVGGVGFGFMLTTRRALEYMVQAYESEWFYDVRSDGSYHRTIGLFDLAYSEVPPDGWTGPWRERLSEDYSFCLRALKCGIQPWLYCGPGVPLTHVGRFGYAMPGAVRSPAP